MSDLKRPLSGEKATGILTVDLIKKKGLGLLVTLAGPSSPPPSDRQLADLVGLLVPSGWYFQEQVNYCRLYQTGLGGTFDEAKKRISPAQIKSNSHALEREFVGGSSGVLFKGFEKFGLSLSPKGVYAFLHHRVIAALLLPDLSKVPLRAAIAQTTVDQAGLACALERYRLANRHFPEKLEDLTPQFIPRLPQDVLTGEFYKYRRDQDTGFILYSVGWDEKDDGGVPGRTLWDEQAGDWVWRYPSK